MSAINLNLQGEVIESRAKESKSHEVDGSGRFLGHRFMLKTKLFGDKRCRYCGKWFHWKDSDCLIWMRSGNVDRLNKDGALEPLHCNSSHCQDWHEAWRKEQQRRKEIDLEQASWSLFKRLKYSGVVS